MFLAKLVMLEAVAVAMLDSDTGNVGMFVTVVVDLATFVVVTGDVLVMLVSVTMV